MYAACFSAGFRCDHLLGENVGNYCHARRYPFKLLCLVLVWVRRAPWRLKLLRPYHSEGKKVRAEGSNWAFVKAEAGNKGRCVAVGGRPTRGG